MVFNPLLYICHNSVSKAKILKKKFKKKSEKVPFILII